MIMTPEEKLTTFLDNPLNRNATVFCVACGSRNVDQNSVFKLRCANCGNEMVWDATRFGIARRSDENDAIRIFLYAEKMVKYESGTDWREEIHRTLIPFILSVIQAMPVREHTTDGVTYEVETGTADSIRSQWETVKQTINRLIEEHLK